MKLKRRQGLAGKGQVFATLKSLAPSLVSKGKLLFKLDCLMEFLSWLSG